MSGAAIAVPLTCHLQSYEEEIRREDGESLTLSLRWLTVGFQESSVGFAMDVGCFRQAANPASGPVRNEDPMGRLLC